MFQPQNTRNPQPCKMFSDRFKVVALTQYNPMYSMNPSPPECCCVHFFKGQHCTWREHQRTRFCLLKILPGGSLCVYVCFHAACEHKPASLLSVKMLFFCRGSEGAYQFGGRKHGAGVPKQTGSISPAEAAERREAR